MTQKENTYNADDFCLFVRKSDNFVMGDCIVVGEDDSINNYTEKKYTKEQIQTLLPPPLRI